MDGYLCKCSVSWFSVPLTNISEQLKRTLEVLVESRLNAAYVNLIFAKVPTQGMTRLILRRFKI